MGDAADHLTETMLDQKALHDAGLCNDLGCEWCKDEDEDGEATTADIIERLRKRARIRAKIDRGDGKPDRIGLQLVEAAERLERLQEELEDIRDSERFILDEDCPTDEKHCGCVLTLRREIERLQAKKTCPVCDAALSESGECWSCEDHRSVL